MKSRPIADMMGTVELDYFFLREREKTYVVMYIPPVSLRCLWLNWVRD